MRTIEYSSDSYIGIEGCEVPIIRFGLAGGLGRVSLYTEDIELYIRRAEREFEAPEYWTDQQVAEIPLNVRYLATCGLAIKEWGIQHRPDARLNPKTSQYAELTTKLQIARDAQRYLTAQAKIFSGDTSYNDFLQQNFAQWGHTDKTTIAL